MTSPLAALQTRQLADQLGDMKNRIDLVERAQRASQLGNSSIEGGGLTVFDDAGIIRIRLGNLGGDSFAIESINNPNPPPVPMGPTLEAGIGVIKVKPNGFVGAVPKPADFSRFNVYVQPQNEPERIDGTIVHDDPWYVSALDYVPHTVWLTAVNLSGKESGPSAVGVISPHGVVSDAITAGAITALELADNAVTAAKLAVAAVGPTQISDSAILTRHLTTNVVQAGNVAADAIQAGNVAANAITGREIFGQTITALHLAANAVTAGSIQAGSVTAAKLAAEIVLAGTRIVAGTLTGNRVEIHYSAGIEAWTNNGAARSFLLDAATGRCVIRGQFGTAFAGARIDMNPDGVNPDTMWFFPTNGAEHASIESFTTGTAAGITVKGSGATATQKAGTLFIRPTYAALGSANDNLTQIGSQMYVEPNYARSRSAVVDLIVDKSITPPDGVRRVAFIHYNTDGSPDPSAQVNYQQSIDSPPRPCFIGTNVNCGIKFDNSLVNIITGDTQAFGPIKASAFLPPSSAAVKQNIAEIDIQDGRTSWDIIEGAPALDWQYITDESDRPEQPAVDGAPVLQRVRNPELSDREFARCDEGDPRKWAHLPTEWQHPPAQKRTHRFPIAEDIAAMDPHLITGDGAADLRDCAGILWDAVDMLIKRNRMLETLLAARFPGLPIPERPQRGDVIGGIGDVVPGRTRRGIDPATGQITTRKRANRAT